MYGKKTVSQDKKKGLQVQRTGWVNVLNRADGGPVRKWRFSRLTWSKGLSRPDIEGKIIPDRGNSQCKDLRLVCLREEQRVFWEHRGQRGPRGVSIKSDETTSEWRGVRREARLHRAWKGFARTLDFILASTECLWAEESRSWGLCWSWCWT